MPELIRYLADGSLIVILIVGGSAVLLGVPAHRRQKVYPLVIMAGLTSLLIGKLASLLYQPTAVRPFIESGLSAGAAYITNPGFPSDHALLATVVVLAVYYASPYKKLAILLALLTLIMSIARVLALVHTPLDIIGGLVAGMSGAIWYATKKYSST